MKSFLIALLIIFNWLIYPNKVNSINLGSGKLIVNTSEINLEKKIALKYCDAQNKKFFEGLDDELILKYQYFFSYIDKKYLPEEKTLLSSLITEVESICSKKVSEIKKKELKLLLNKFYAK